MNINNCAEMIRAMTGRVSWVPLVLSLNPQRLLILKTDVKKLSIVCP